MSKQASTRMAQSWELTLNDAKIDFTKLTKSGSKMVSYNSPNSNSTSEKIKEPLKFYVYYILKRKPKQ